MSEASAGKCICYHLPGLFEFGELYRRFLPLFYEKREWFYDWCGIGSLYGAPADCIWGGGRVGCGEEDPEEALALLRAYGISARLTFSNSLLREEHLRDRRCNALCARLAREGEGKHGVIVSSELLLGHLREHFPELYPVSSTTKVLTDFSDFEREVRREEFRYAVPDFRLNRAFARWDGLAPELRGKVEFLCNEGCWYGCPDRRRCYEQVSRKCLGESLEDFPCRAPHAAEGYRFSRAMESPGFIGPEEILRDYAPRGFTQFKLEGRGLGSAVVLELLLFYLTKPEYRLRVREEIYLDSCLNLF